MKGLLSVQDYDHKIYTLIMKSSAYAAPSIDNPPI